MCFGGPVFQQMKCSEGASLLKRLNESQILMFYDTELLMILEYN